MKLDRNSYVYVTLIILFSLSLVWILFRYVDIPWISWPLSFFLIWLVIFVLCFARVPNRRKAGSSTTVTSVADGEVVIIEKAFEKEFLKRDCIQVSVYMNFFDMHANFWPVDGEVTYYRYHPGKHFLAFKPKASEENEHTCVCIHTPEGKDVFFKQIAGGFARRIVCYAKTGLDTTAGQQCGIIKFGSRIDMFLPLDADIKVELGTVTRACETVIAQL